MSFVDLSYNGRALLVGGPAQNCEISTGASWLFLCVPLVPQSELQATAYLCTYVCTSYLRRSCILHWFGVQHCHVGYDLRPSSCPSSLISASTSVMSSLGPLIATNVYPPIAKVHTYNEAEKYRRVDLLRNIAHLHGASVGIGTFGY